MSSIIRTFESNPSILVIQDRGKDFVCTLQDNEGVWGVGANIPMAIGNMIVRHPDQFDMVIDFGMPNPSRMS